MPLISTNIFMFRVNELVERLLSDPATTGLLKPDSYSSKSSIFDTSRIPHLSLLTQVYRILGYLSLLSQVYRILGYLSLLTQVYRLQNTEYRYLCFRWSKLKNADKINLDIHQC